MSGDKKLGNLVNYGIQNEEADYRVHICFIVGLAYLFPVASGQEAVDSGQYRKVGGRQPGVDFITSEGYLVPPSSVDLPGLAEIQVPEDLLGRARNRLAQLSGPAWTRAKGRAAEWIGEQMRSRGMFAPFIFMSKPKLEDQLRGIDAKGPSFQYKCDYRGGPKHLGGSGHLFLQVKERNPLNLH